MKKLIKKFDLKTSDSIKLGSIELSQLRGGADIYNTNTTAGCTCDWKNHSATYNENKEIGCTCFCS